MQNNVDFQGYNRLLTNFAIERGSGGSFAIDEFAPPTPVDTQEYSVPKFETQLVKQGITNTLVGPDGDVNIVEDISPTMTPGFCMRHGLKGYTLDEVKAQPHGDLFANEETVLSSLIDDMRREKEIAFKALLDARKSVSGYHASPGVKWDAAGFTNVIAIENLEAAARAAELNSARSLDSGKWKLLIPPLVADRMKSYLRQALKYTDGQFTLGGKLPTILADMPVVIPGSMQNSAAAGQTASVARIWNTDDVYLIYVDPAFASNRRAFTAFAQMRWNKVSASYASYTWRDQNPMIKRTWVGTDIYDNLEFLSVDGVYVVDDVLT
jgi:hypothetical protein